MIRLFYVFEIVFDLWEVEIFSSAAAKSVEDVETGGLEVRGGVVSLGDEELRLDAVVDRLEHVTDVDELLLDWTQQSDTCIQKNS